MSSIVPKKRTWKLNLSAEQLARRVEIGKARRGEKRSDEARKRMSISKTGIKLPPFTEEHKRKISESEKGKVVSEETRKKMSGPNCKWWKGGTTKVSLAIRMLFEYRQWRSDIFSRDDWTCQNCNVRGGILHAHHIDYLSNIIHRNGIKDLDQARNCSELWNINNGITLCKKCHKDIHKK